MNGVFPIIKKSFLTSRRDKKVLLNKFAFTLFLLVQSRTHLASLINDAAG
jgi:hypothetical protein